MSSSGTSGSTQLPPIVFPEGEAPSETKKLKQVDSADAERPDDVNLAGEEIPEPALVTKSPTWMKFALVVLLLAAAGLGIAVAVLADQKSELESDVSFWRSSARSNSNDEAEAEDRAAAAETALEKAESRATAAEQDLAEVRATAIAASDIANADLDDASLAVSLERTTCEWGGTGCDDPDWETTELNLQISCSDSSTCLADDLNDEWWSGDLRLTRNGTAWSGDAAGRGGWSCSGVRYPVGADNVTLDLTVTSASPQAGGTMAAAGVDAQLGLDVTAPAGVNCTGVRMEYVS